MRVELIYRNYKPLHKIYESLVTLPPKGVEYIVPPARTKLRKLYPLYTRIRYNRAGKLLIRVFERTVFTKKDHDENVDIYHYLNMIDEKPPAKPYIVDIEHGASLLSFSPNPKRLVLVKKFLSNPMCKSIDCMSEAARHSLQRILGKDFDLIASKVHIIYPALEAETLKPDHTYIPKNTQTLQLIFVGNNAYLKGLQEVLEAVKHINGKYSTDALKLHVISSDANILLEQYSLANVQLYPPKFSKKDIFSMFFMPADAFILPTKEDTFGMAILDSFVCGTPVIATDQFAIPELVINNKDGLLIHLDKALLDTVTIPGAEDTKEVTIPNLNQQTVKEISRIIEKILNGKVDLNKMGKLGQQKFEPGNKFSIELRNKKILEIYEDALSE